MSNQIRQQHVDHILIELDMVHNTIVLFTMAACAPNAERSRVGREGVLKMKSRIRWGRVIAAALLSELAVIVILLAITLTYSVLISPGRSWAEYQRFGDAAGYYVAPVASGFATFLSVFWMARRLTSNFIINGTLVGVVAVILTAGFLFGAKSGDRPMYIASFAVRILAGSLGGLTMQAIFNRRRASAASAIAEAEQSA